MGNFIRALDARALLVASPQTWIEGKATQQLLTTASLAGMQRVAGMPDLHPGRGYPVGAAFFSRGIIYPALVGNDIGCGMMLWQTDVRAASFKPEYVQKRIGSIDMPLSSAERLALDAHAPSDVPGTIGAGNHFAELLQIDATDDPVAAQSLGLEHDRLLLLVHSGSRGLGERILQTHIQRFGHRGLDESTPEFDAYLIQHHEAMTFAQHNRNLIALRLLRRLRAHGFSVLDLAHNTLTPYNDQGQNGWLHRKGAAPADAGPVVIPGSRGDHSYIVMPLAGAASAIALHSLAHGAGRKWMRSECKGRLLRYNAEQLKRPPIGSRVICDNRELLYEEAPQAYKPIGSIIETLEGAGLVRVIARFKPVLTYKTRHHFEEA